MAKFVIGSPAMHMHSKDGQTKPIAEARYDKAYPAQWWYRLNDERRWYPENHLWDADDWNSFQSQQAEYRRQHEQQERDRLNPPAPPRIRDYVTAIEEPRYGYQYRKYREAFVNHVDYYYGAWEPPYHLAREYMRCLGFRED